MPVLSQHLGTKAAAGHDPQRAPVEKVVSGESLVAALQGTIAPVRVGMGYRAGLLAATVVMLLLPLVYVAVIGLVAPVSSASKLPETLSLDWRA